MLVLSKGGRRRARRRDVAAPSLLVASTLVINAFDSCRAAPRPVPSTGAILDSRRSFADVDDALPDSIRDEPSQARLAAFRKEGLVTPSVSTNIGRPPPSRRSISFATTSGNKIIVPSSFASSIASSWNPGERSVWFQRKAVIIIAIFLAIIIVLTIGAAVFLRDQREQKAEGEVDVSDEAALARMREEREMRNGSKRNKKKKKKQKDRRKKEGEEEKEQSGGRTAGCSTGIIPRWAKIPARRLRKRGNKKMSLSSASKSTETVVYEGSLSAPDSPPASAGLAGVEGGERPSSTASDSRAQDSTDQASNGSPSDTHDSQARQHMHRQDSPHDPLSVADLTAAEEEADRAIQGGTDGDNTDMLPPAYIASNSRSGAVGGGGDAVARLHPSANRPLAAAGASSSAAEAMADEKVRPQEESVDLREDSHDSSTMNSERLPSILESSTSAAAAGGGQEHYSAHIATDDKLMLGRLHHAASTPSAMASSPPSEGRRPGDSTVPHPTSASLVATAPSPEASAPDLDPIDEYEQSIAADGDIDAKGKASSLPASHLLPAPPKPLVSTAFSRFDMPYFSERTSNPSTPTPIPIPIPNPTLAPSASAPLHGNAYGKEKAREADEESRQALAVMESRPEDMAQLPRYETEQKATPSAPSAPALEEEEEEGEEAEQATTSHPTEAAISPIVASSSAPSAPTTS